MPTEPIEVVPFQFYDPSKPMPGVMDFRPNPTGVLQRDEQPTEDQAETDKSVIFCETCPHVLVIHDSETGCADCDCSFTGTTTPKVETSPPIV